MARARRPNPDFLSLEEVERFVATAWEVVEASTPQNRGRAEANALRLELQVYTGLRPGAGELHGLRVRDVREDGYVEIVSKPGLKWNKPRVTMFVNPGAPLEASPTLEKVQQYVARRGLGPDDLLWSSDYKAYWAFIRDRVAPASGIDRPTRCLNGADLPRYRLRPHLPRSGFVFACRHGPQRLGRPPMAWEDIADLGGWEDSTVLRRHYWWVNVDETREAVRRALGPAAGTSSRALAPASSP